MPEPHVFDARTMEWSADARFPGIGLKLLESRTTHPTTSVVLVKVEPGGVINTHEHPVETETFYVLAGQGTLTADGVDYVFDAGMGGSIPPATPHSMRNTGEGALEMIAMHSPPTR